MKWLKKINIETFIRESCLLVGFFMLGYGMWLIYPPASFVICGTLLMWVGLPARPKGGD
jgi:hypothetical protein